MKSEMHHMTKTSWIDRSRPVSHVLYHVIKQDKYGVWYIFDQFSTFCYVRAPHIKVVIC